MKVYTKCYICRQEKPPTASGYCNPCGREYNRQRSLRLKNKTYSYDDIEMFRNKVISNYYLIDLIELNTIISIYSEIVFNINEYDNFKPGEQIMKMWDKIMNHKETIKDKPKFKKEKKVTQREWVDKNRERVNRKRREYYSKTGK